jgi:hypothetical protein
MTQDWLGFSVVDRGGETQTAWQSHRPTFNFLNKESRPKVTYTYNIFSLIEERQKERKIGT